MTKRLDPARHPWMAEPETRAVMEALTNDGGDARFVGGAVRNALLGARVEDIDIATPLLPDDVAARLKRAGLGAVPTGIAHGTITAVASGKPYEITTLRRDVTTDGRRATVAFTEDWAEDAGRRDFTMNALYADADGNVFDPTGGIADLDARRVRFVGDPVTRIREDYLRILRLFRFHAWYGSGALDAAALEAAIRERAGLTQLSGERVQKELLRLLEAKGAPSVIADMERAGILGEILPGRLNVARLQRLTALSKAEHLGHAPVLSLAALLGSADEARAAASRLKLSNADRERLIGALAEPVDLFQTPAKLRRLAYRTGVNTVIDRILIAEAEHDGLHGNRPIETLRLWTPPTFPLDGKDAMEAGVPEGPAVGRILKTLETWWIEQDFIPDRPTLLLQLKELLLQPDS